MSCAKEQGAYLFTREQTSFLISLYEQEDILYNVGNPLYKNKTKRLLALKMVQKNFNEKYLISNVSLEDVRKKINNLRTQYFAEVNKIKKSIVSGAGTTDVYTPTLWFFEQLQFLDSSNPIKKSISNLEIGDEPNEREEERETVFEGTVQELNEGTVRTDSRAESPVRSPISRASTSASNRCEEVQIIKKRKRSSLTPATHAISLMEKATNWLETSEAKKNDEPLNLIDAFLVTVGAELREIKNVNRSLQVRRQILNYIYEAQQEEMDEEY